MSAGFLAITAGRQSLLTGVKQTGIPLAVLWMIAAWAMSRCIAFANPKTFFVMAASSLLVSAVPTVIFNFLHTGTWDGVQLMETEYPQWHVQLDSPFWGIIGNAFYIPVLSLLPPFFPWSGAWNRAMDAFVWRLLSGHISNRSNISARWILAFPNHPPASGWQLYWRLRFQFARPENIKPDSKSNVRVFKPH